LVFGVGQNVFGGGGVFVFVFFVSRGGGGGGGGTPLYGLQRYVRPQRVGFFSRFGSK